MDRLVLTAGTLLVTSTFLIAVIVVPATLISVVVLRRHAAPGEFTTATAALRAGDLSARVPVSGEDEVARLQAGLQRHGGGPGGGDGRSRAERDTVARLLQARRELVASVSHELRTPVATLRAYLDPGLDDQLPGQPSAVPDRRARWQARRPCATTWR